MGEGEGEGWREGRGEGECEGRGERSGVEVDGIDHNLWPKRPPPPVASVVAAQVHVPERVGERDSLGGVHVRRVRVGAAHLRDACSRIGASGMHAERRGQWDACSDTYGEGSIPHGRGKWDACTHREDDTLAAALVLEHLVADGACSAAAAVSERAAVPERRAAQPRRALLDACIREQLRQGA